jgi:uncharacterized membrane protein YraQ (UPF0718 family)
VIDLAKLDSSHDAPSVPPPCCKKVEKPAEESPVVLLGKPNSAPDTCCHPPAPPSTLFIRIVQGLRFGFIDLIDDTAHVLTVSFLLAGCIAVFVPADLFAAIGLSPTASMLLMLVLSFPLYVCATSSTPLAAALLAKGLNPGAALVFLLAGPASNTATMVAIRDHLGRASLITYLAGISLLSLTAGFLVNASGLIPLTALREPEAHHHTHSIASVILLTLLALSAIRKVQRAQLAR